MKSKILALLGSTLLTGTAMAGGYQVNLASQRQIGMGHTGTGLNTGTSSIFFNPGAMAQARNGVTIGASAIISKIAYQAPESNNTIQADNPTGTPFQVYGVYGITDKLKAGLGVYTPFGSTVDWGNEWNGRFGLNELSLKTIFIQPTLSYQITDKLGIGAGFVYSTGGVNLQRSIPLENEAGEGRAELDGDASGMGYNLGIFFKPSDKLSFGLNYRSQVDMEVEDGTAEFDVPASVRARFPEGTTFTAELPLPSTLTLGIGFNPSEKLTLALDVSRVGWSAYEKLRFDYQNESGNMVNGATFSENARNYDDAYIYRIGAEYKVTDALVLRGGAYYDETPVQDGYLTPETPDSDSRGLSAGLGYTFSEKLSVDASFLYINKKERTDASNLSGGIAGTYKSIAYIPGLAVNYNF